MDTQTIVNLALVLAFILVGGVFAGEGETLIEPVPAPPEAMVE